MLDADLLRLKSERTALRQAATIKGVGLAIVGTAILLALKPRLAWMPVVITLIAYGLTWLVIDRDFRAVSKHHD